MGKVITILSLVLLFASGCNSQNTEEAVEGYLSETLNGLKDQLPRELKVLDSLLLDSVTIQQKIAETTNLDSLEKYNDLLRDAKNLLQKDISTVDSIGPGIEQLLEFNQ